jgi:hypothetical protein
MSSMKVSLRQSVLVVVTILACTAGPTIAGCTAPPMVDGWSFGAMETCPPPNVPLGESYPEAWDCDATLAVWLAAAREALDRDDPGHAPVGEMTLHEYAGNARFLSNCCLVAVLRLNDRTVRAFGVAQLGIDTTRVSALPHGPDDD